MATDSMLAEILNTTRSLSVEEKVQLIRGMTDQVEQDLKGIKKTQKRSLRGMWKGLDITDREIRENREEMWGNFPRIEYQESVYASSY